MASAGAMQGRSQLLWREHRAARGCVQAGWQLAAPAAYPGHAVLVWNLCADLH